MPVLRRLFGGGCRAEGRIQVESVGWGRRAAAAGPTPRGTAPGPGAAGDGPGSRGAKAHVPGVERGAARSVGKWRNVHDLYSALGGEGRSVAAPGGRGQEGAGCSVRLPRVGHR